MLIVQAAASPTFGDFGRTVYDLQTEWSIFGSMRLIGELSYFQNQGAPNENYVSVRYRYDL